jgi:hypothetical protein
MGKRIILLLDGTWNDAEFGTTDTNIVRLREIISRDLIGTSLSSPAGAKSIVSTKVDSDEGPNEHVVFYQRGVGTGAFLDRFTGGAFGAGLVNNIRSAYKVLSFHYEPGDQVFVFGFSRGSYTARSLVGYIAAAGLLKRNCCTQELESIAWHFYRTRSQDRMPATWTKLQDSVHNRSEFRIECVGVFDTVGALGMPLAAFWRANREQYEFHNVELSPIVNVSLQALAIDEHREPFQATLWRSPKFIRSSNLVEQVWFAGAHADIGGGYVARKTLTSPPGLDDISLNWMLKRVRRHFDNFPAQSDPPDCSWSDLPQHESRKRIYRLLRFGVRSIANCHVPAEQLLKRKRQVNVNYDRHSHAIREGVHISAIQRIGKKVKIDEKDEVYKPLNLRAVLSLIKDTYNPEKQRDDKAYLIDWSGEFYNPSYPEDRSAVEIEIKNAEDRLEKNANWQLP